MTLDRAETNEDPSQPAERRNDDTPEASVQIERAPDAGRVLVFGAASLVGGFLLPRLAARGLDVVALSRRRREDQRSGHHGRIVWRRGDLCEPNLGAETPRAVATVSLAPIWRLAPAVSSLADLGVRRLVAFSSTSRLTKATSTDAGERRVAMDLAKGEDETIAACDRRGVAWTLLRPTLIYAEGQDRNVSRLAALIGRTGLLPLCGDGEGLRQPVHADDLASAAVQALDAPASVGRIYDLPGGETLSYRAMAERIFEGVNRPARILSIPRPLWRLGLALASPLLPGTSPAMGDRMGVDLTFDASAARRDLDWSPRPFHPHFLS